MKAPNTTRAMDEALDWLIELDCASAEAHAEFQAWLAADPANREAFSHAQALWNSNAVAQAAAVQPRPPSALEKLRRQWKPLATAAVLLMSLTSFSNLPTRLQADRQRPHIETLAVTGTYRLDSPYVVRSFGTITSTHLHELPSVMLLN